MPNTYTRARRRWHPTCYPSSDMSAIGEGHLWLPRLSTSACPSFLLVHHVSLFLLLVSAIVHVKHTGVLYPHPHTREQLWTMMRKWEDLPGHSATLPFNEPHVAHVDNDQKPRSLRKIAQILIQLLEVYKMKSSEMPLGVSWVLGGQRMGRERHCHFLWGFQLLGEDYGEYGEFKRSKEVNPGGFGSACHEDSRGAQVQPNPPALPTPRPHWGLHDQWYHPLEGIRYRCNSLRPKERSRSFPQGKESCSVQENNVKQPIYYFFLITNNISYGCGNKMLIRTLY